MHIIRNLNHITVQSLTNLNNSKEVHIICLLEIPYKNLKGLKRTPEMCQDLLLWAWLEFFSPLRDTNYKITNYLSSYFLLTPNPKRYLKTTHWGGNLFFAPPLPPSDYVR